MTISQITRWFLPVIALAVFVASVAVRQSADVVAVGDGAATSLAVIDAIHGRALLGPYSQFGWHHPGPLLFYLFAPFYYVSGYHEASLRWASLGVNVAALAGMALVLIRAARPIVSVAVLAGLTLFALRAGGEFLYSMWNPLITVLPLAALVCLAAAVARGSTIYLPWCGVVATFLVQSNIALVPVTAAILMASAAMLLSPPPPARSTLNGRGT